MATDFEVTNHSLVPLHEVLEKKEEAELLKEYDITKDQLPIIPKNDVVVKQIGAKPGSVIKITRNSQTAGKAIYYRLVK